MCGGMTYKYPNKTPNGLKNGAFSLRNLTPKFRLSKRTERSRSFSGANGTLLKTRSLIFLQQVGQKLINSNRTSGKRMSLKRFSFQPFVSAKGETPQVSAVRYARDHLLDGP